MPCFWLTVPGGVNRKRSSEQDHFEYERYYPCHKVSHSGRPFRVEDGYEKEGIDEEAGHHVNLWQLSQ